MITELYYGYHIVLLYSYREYGYLPVLVLHYSSEQKRLLILYCSSVWMLYSILYVCHI